MLFVQRKPRKHTFRFRFFGCYCTKFPPAVPDSPRILSFAELLQLN